MSRSGKEDEDKDFLPKVEFRNNTTTSNCWALLKSCLINLEEVEDLLCWLQLRFSTRSAQAKDIEQTFIYNCLSPWHESLPIVPQNNLFILCELYDTQSLGLCTQNFLRVGKAIVATQGSRFNPHSITVLQELALSKMVWDLRQI